MDSVIQEPLEAASHLGVRHIGNGDVGAFKKVWTVKDFVPGLTFDGALCARAGCGFAGGAQATESERPADRLERGCRI